MQTGISCSFATRPGCRCLLLGDTIHWAWLWSWVHFHRILTPICPSNVCKDFELDGRESHTCLVWGAWHIWSTEMSDPRVAFMWHKWIPHSFISIYQVLSSIKTTFTCTRSEGMFFFMMNLGTVKSLRQRALRQPSGFTFNHFLIF